ncbi:MarR family winged helix-turn-helix transcriptional regulator [Rhodococcus sp. KRD162]|uniref:MarR family winged helix-turn-helix transcriptional regulator n=1 Tax=unclassified Rhodococcus (in: high G+C Gram-positive bacteria) TaxID=192944 RepID=UPI0019D020B5|nr:MarR family transcriptional regulator [Rhodococcus sp. KRD162]
MIENSDAVDGGVGPLSAYREAVDAKYGAGSRYGVALHLMRVERHVGATIESVLRQYKLSRPQWSVLTILHLAPATRIPLGRIATALQVHGTIITNAVDRLAVLGLAERVVDPGDRRSVLAIITDDGERCVDDIMTKLAEQQFGLKELAARDIGTLSRILNTVCPEE